MKKSLSMIFVLFVFIFLPFTTQTAFADEQSDIAKYTEQIKNNPNDYEAYKNRGNAYFYLNQCERAIEDYTKAIELNPNDKNIYQNRGHSYFRLSNYQQAI